MRSPQILHNRKEINAGSWNCTRNREQMTEVYKPEATLFKNKTKKNEAIKNTTGNKTSNWLGPQRIIWFCDPSEKHLVWPNWRQEAFTLAGLLQVSFQQVQGLQVEVTLMSGYVCQSSGNLLKQVYLGKLKFRNLKKNITIETFRPIVLVIGEGEKS